MTPTDGGGRYTALGGYHDPLRAALAMGQAGVLSPTAVRAIAYFSEGSRRCVADCGWDGATLTGWVRYRRRVYRPEAFNALIASDCGDGVSVTAAPHAAAPAGVDIAGLPDLAAMPALLALPAPTPASADEAWLDEPLDADPGDSEATVPPPPRVRVVSMAWRWLNGLAAAALMTMFTLGLLLTLAVVAGWLLAQLVGLLANGLAALL